MAKQPGTAPTQFMQVITALGQAVATIIGDFSIGDLINCLNRKGEQLTLYLRLVFTALMEEQELVLAPPQEHKQEVEAKSEPQPKEEVEDLGWIELDPAISFPDRVTACDFKGGVHPNITADKSKLKRKVRRHIVLYSGPGSTEEMRRRIRANGDRPCDVDDGTGIGKTYPQRQVGNPLVLLDEGSVCLDGGRGQCAPVLGDWDGRREFSLYRLAGVWNGDYRFPAVREEEFLDN